jgi:hypothetical protein
MAVRKEERIAETAEQDVYVKKLKYNHNALFNQTIGKGLEGCAEITAD